MASASVLVYKTESSPNGGKVWLSKPMPELDLWGDYYHVKCQYGHQWAVEPGSELEQECKERRAEGYIEALTVSTSECPACIEWDQEHHRWMLAADLDEYDENEGWWDAQNNVQPRFPSNPAYMHGYNRALVD